MQLYYTAEENYGAIVAIAVCLRRTLIELSVSWFALVSFTDLKKTCANWTCPTPAHPHWRFPRPFSLAPHTISSDWFLKCRVASFTRNLMYVALGITKLPCVNFMDYISFLLYLRFCFDGLLMWTDLNCCSVSVHCNLTANTTSYRPIFSKYRHFCAKLG